MLKDLNDFSKELLVLLPIIAAILLTFFVTRARYTRKMRAMNEQTKQYVEQLRQEREDGLKLDVLLKEEPRM